MKLSIYNNNNNVLLTSFLDQLSTFGWKGTVTAAASAEESIIIDSESIISVKDYLTKHTYMSYDQVEQMILHLGNQLFILSENKLGLLFFSLDDIIIIDEIYFFISDLKHMVPMNKKEQLCLNFPLKMEGEDMFLSPELLNVTTLPIITTITSTYYSLALLCIRCLALRPSAVTIKHTKMYYFLERCLQTDPNERYFLYL